MPDVRLGIDASRARQGAQELSQSFELVRRSAERTVRTIRQVEQAQRALGTARGQSTQTAQTVQAIERQSQATKRLSLVEQDRIRAAREQIRADAQVLRTRQQAQRALTTALSTLGRENRAISQRIQFENRLKQAIDAGIISQRRANQLRQQANRVFSTQSVDMARLNDSVRRLSRSVSVLAFGPLSGVGARIITIQSAAQAGGAALVGMSLGAAAVAVGLGAITREGSQAERILARLEGVLKATEGAAGLTLNQIDKLTRDIGRETLASTDDVRAAAAQLLTFRTISVEAFERTLRAAQDLAELGFGSVQMATVQLAKALEDPATNLSNLRRVGVSFTRAQEEQIKALSESGNLLEAQSILLAQIERQAGGAGAAAAVGTLAGSWDSLTEVIKQSAEELNTFLGLTEKLRQGIDFLTAGLEEAVTTPDERLEQINKLLPQLERALSEGRGIPQFVGPGGVAPVVRQLRQERAELFRAQQEGKFEEQIARNTGAAEQFRLAQERSSAAVEELQKRFDDQIRAQKELESVQRTLNGAVRVGVITREEANRIEGLARESLESSTAAAKESARAERERARELEKVRKAQQELSQFVFTIDSQTEALQRELEAIRGGEEALRGFNVEQRTAEQLRQANILAAKTGIDLSDEETRALEERIRKQEEIRSEIERETDLRQEQAREAERAARLAQEPFLEAARNIQNAFTNTFEQIFSGGIDSFSDLADAIKRIFIRLAAEMATLLIFRPQVVSQQGGISGVLSQVIGGGQGSSLSGVSSLLGLLGGGAAQTGTLPLGTGILSAQTGPPIGGIVSVEVVRQPGVLERFARQGLDLLGVSANAQTRLVSTLGQAASTAPLGIGGALIGSEIAQGLRLSTGIGSSIGGGLGATAGAIGGSILGPVGTVVGAAIGQIVGEALGGSVQAVAKGESPFQINTTSESKARLAAGTRGAVLGALFLGPAAASLGAIIGLIFAEEIKKASVQLQTGGGGFAFGQQATGPFGAVGLNAGGSSRINAGFARSLSTFFAEFDRSVAAFLDPQEIRRAGQGLRSAVPLRDKFAEFDNELFNLAVDRLNNIISAVVGPVSGVARGPTGPVQGLTGQLIEGLPRNQQGVQQLVERFQEFFGERAGVRVQIERLIRGDRITEAEQAVAQLNEQFSELAAKARELFVSQQDLVRLEEARVATIERLTTEFDRDIQSRITGIVDPFRAAFEELEEQQDQRLREAEFLGANLVEVERLNLLERQRLLEQQGSEIRRFLENITSGGASPLAPQERLRLAEERFAAARTAEAFDPGELVSAAGNLLEASRSVFASSEQFFERFEFVRRTLENVLSDIPSFQSGGSFVVPGGSSSTQLFAAHGGERVSVSRGEEEQLLRALGQTVATGQVSRDEILGGLLREMRGLRTEVSELRDEVSRMRRRRAAA